MLDGTRAPQRGRHRATLVGKCASPAARSVKCGETVILWHQEIARWIWAWKSRPKRRAPSHRTPDDLRALVVSMAEKSPRWGPERIVGELLKLEHVLAKRTVERILKARWPNGRDRGQSWATFVRNHVEGTWACDFFTVTTIAFKQLYVFFVMDLETRRIVHANVTDAPSGEWTTQQIRNATWETTPKRLVRDRDAKYVEAFDLVVETAGGEVLLIPPRTPVAKGDDAHYTSSERCDLIFRTDCITVSNHSRSLRLRPELTEERVQTRSGVDRALLVVGAFPRSAAPAALGLNAGRRAPLRVAWTRRYGVRHGRVRGSLYRERREAAFEQVASPVRPRTSEHARPLVDLRDEHARETERNEVGVSTRSTVFRSSHGPSFVSCY